MKHSTHQSETVNQSQDFVNKLLNATECFAIRGREIVDVIDSHTGLTLLGGKTLEEIQREDGLGEDYYGVLPSREYHFLVERMTIDEFNQSKAKEQDTPVTWEEITEERYDELLGCLPPAAYRQNGFLVGEPWDHHAITGQPRYQACRIINGHWLASTRAMSIKEFKALILTEGT